MFILLLVPVYLYTKFTATNANRTDVAERVGYWHKAQMQARNWRQIHTKFTERYSAHNKELTGKMITDIEDSHNNIFIFLFEHLEAEVTKVLEAPMKALQNHLLQQAAKKAPNIEKEDDPSSKRIIRFFTEITLNCGFILTRLIKKTSKSMPNASTFFRKFIHSEAAKTYKTALRGKVIHPDQSKYAYAGDLMLFDDFVYARTLIALKSTLKQDVFSESQAAMAKFTYLTGLDQSTSAQIGSICFAYSNVFIEILVEFIQRTESLYDMAKNEYEKRSAAFLSTELKRQRQFICLLGNTLKE